MGKILDAFSDEQLLVNAVTEKRSSAHQKLEEKLNEGQRGLLAQLLDTMENEHNCDAQNRFIRGYSWGMLMAIEVMEKRDKFLIKEEDCIS